MFVFVGRVEMSLKGCENSDILTTPHHGGSILLQSDY
jgi:hypothetical protein